MTSANGRGVSASENPAEAQAEQTATEAPQAENDGAGPAFLGKSEPHEPTAQNHKDQTGRDGVHGIRP